MESKATATYIRMSPRKVQIVCDLIRGKDTKVASAILAQTNKMAAAEVLKVLKNAVACAENNFSMDADNLYVAQVYANGGTIMKRIQPRAKGRAYRINKRTSHITVVVREKE